jgi:hypothetical protein
MITGGCSDRDAVRVQLQAYAPPAFDVRRVEIRAQVAGPPDGLRYKWFSVNGQTDPQESEQPVSVFTFGDGTTRDRVSVELWRGDERVAYGEIDVKLDEERARLAMQSAPPLTIAITEVPPYDAGGPDTRANIAGTVTGTVSPADRVVIYARADVWYIQPAPNAIHLIGSDGKWSSWTHTGTSYAAFIVRPGFDPLPRYDVLPQVGGYIVGRTIVEGTKR